MGLKKDGTLWKFPEFFNFTNKSPMGNLKRIGKDKDWDKVVLGCCSMYALKIDGTLWINRGTSHEVNFKIFDYSSECGAGDQSFCKKLKTLFSQMPSQSLYSYEDTSAQNINIATKAGILCVMPEIHYK